MPFHVWTPDVYEGAPTPVTAFMSVGPKAAAFAMFLRVFFGGFGPLDDQWRWLVGAAAALTMVWGNIAALTQDNVKRMLAYSSIAHAGYALVGLVAGGPAGVQSVLFYMLVYTVTNLGAFGFVIMLESRGYAGETVQDYAGLARKHPLAAFGMLLFMLSLGGIPPTAGFMGKLYLFAAAVNAGLRLARGRGGPDVGGVPLLLLPHRPGDVPARRRGGAARARWSRRRGRSG